jgi:hypothetical protein
MSIINEIRALDIDEETEDVIARLFKCCEIMCEVITDSQNNNPNVFTEAQSKEITRVLNALKDGPSVEGESEIEADEEPLEGEIVFSGEDGEDVEAVNYVAIIQHEGEDLTAAGIRALQTFIANSCDGNHMIH